MEIIEEIKKEFKDKKCFDCIHCSDVVGSAHKQCNYNFLNEIKGLILLKLSSGKFNKNPTYLNYENIPIMEFHETGLSNGWVLFPFNFDPVWLNYCLLFKNKN